MLQIIVPSAELYDEKKEEFIYSKEQIIELEHSLISISKWESKHKKPFLKSQKTKEETIDYIRCMSLNKTPDSSYYSLTNKNIEDIQNYINDPMTATIIRKLPNSKSNVNEIVTSELIYYWMIVSNIPFECEKWHINRLLTLIKICTVKNSPNKKMSKNEIIKEYSAINKARRAQMNSGG
ncbi:MAG: hypothetical protein GX660_04300 [Clostridiaceae bacterium]|nr:hypothetical protein [Clostridiaceae bacterium]